MSAERVRDEWFKGLRTARSLRRLCGLWWRVGAAPVWLPELIESEVPEPAIEQRDPVVLTALYCLDPVSVLRRLKASNHDIARAAAMMAGPREPGAVDARGLRYWLADVGGAADDLMLLARLRAGARPGWAIAADEIRARREPVARKDLAVTGSDLLTLGIPPGPALGDLLDRLLRIVLDDPAQNERDTLLRHAQALQ